MRLPIRVHLLCVCLVSLVDDLHLLLRWPRLLTLRVLRLILLLLWIILLVLTWLLRRFSVFLLRNAVAFGIQLSRIVLEEKVELVDALLDVVEVANLLVVE